MAGPWHVSLADETREYGWNEDGPTYCEVYFLVATDARGQRFIGPILGNSRDNDVAEIKRQAEAFDATLLDPKNDDNWQPWFPCYGSEAYQNSGQEEANAWAERHGEPYFPV